MNNIEKSGFLLFLIFVYGVLLIPAFHIQHKIKYLPGNKFFRLLLFILTFVSLLGFVLYFYELVSSSTAFLFFTPVYQLVLYRFMYSIFVLKYKSEPKDMGGDYISENWPDRFLQLGYIFFSMILVMLIFGILKFS